MRHCALALAATSLVLLTAAGCTDVPEQVASSEPRYERGIDQDISATHNGGAATADNLTTHAPWRINQRW